MCGIAGIVSIDGGLSALDVAPMCAALRHRGPDSRGAWSDGLCALGHERLAVIDLSAEAAQPICNESRTRALVVNGEIYNFAGLRDELQALGCRFRSHGDSEVILHAYERWGAGCLERLRGMFALALWDGPARRLLLARDRVGKKPLFFAQSGSAFLFSSELQGLLAHPSVRRNADVRAIDAYLSWGYVPAPSTAFRGISKLPPAHALVVDVSNGTIATTSQQYWSLHHAPKRPISRDDAAQLIRTALTDAVRVRLASDVPVGAFLSGGIDSSIVVGLMAQAMGRPVQTFTIGFEDSSYNEAPFARQVARRWRTDHHEWIVRPDALEVLPTLVRHFGEPYADSSAIPTFQLARLTRSQVTVALSGDGGDESFAGYDRYRALRVSEIIRAIPGGRPAARALASILPDSIDFKSPVRRARRFFGALSSPTWRRYAQWNQYFTDDRKTALYSPDMREACDASQSQRWLESLVAADGNLDVVDTAMAIDVRSYLPYDLLVKADITSMAHGLEVRSPFLDHQVMECAAALPAECKLRGSETKSILRSAFGDLLDPATASRPKAGFGVPIGAWFRGPLRPLLHDTLLSGHHLARGYFDPTTVRRYVDEHDHGRRDHASQLWCLLMLELWHRQLC